MKTADVIKYFGSARKASEALGISTQAIYAWGECVPESRHAHVELATRGKLKRDKTPPGERKGA